MDFYHNNVRRVSEEDRLSNLPDELIYKILSCFDTQFAVQTCLLSSRWKFLWRSVPSLKFSSQQFRALNTFAKFVNHVLSHRNHQIEVSLVNLEYHGTANQDFLKKLAEYVFSHNAQQLTVISTSSRRELPRCLFSSQSLKHFTLVCAPFITSLPKTPLDFPALTTLKLRYVTLRGDLFSKCVNLKNLTLEIFYIDDMEVFDIITPRLSNLMLINCRRSKVINVIAPQLENLTVIRCTIKYLNAPPGLSSLCYTFHLFSCSLLQFSNDRFHSLNKVTISLFTCYPRKPYKEEDAHKTINMLQQLRSARYLTLNADIVEYISLFPDLLSRYPSPFSNLICLTIDYSKKKGAFKVTLMSNEARNFLLENSPRAKLIHDLPKVPSKR